MVKDRDVRGVAPAAGHWTELGQRARVRVAIALALLQAACPQLLDDEFELATASAPDPTDTTPPTVVQVTPGDGFAGVAPEVVIVVTFSEPMDRASVESAYTSSDLPSSAVSFAWSDDDTVLRITPRAPLTVATGSDPDEVVAATYQFELTSSAHDLSGNPLASERVEFSVVREITETLGGVRDRNLTGNWRSDGIYGVLDCEETDATLCVGDSLSADSTTYKGFVTFDLSDLGAAAGVSQAWLSLEVSTIFGDPFLDLGSLALEHVDYDEIGAEAFASEPLSVLGSMASSGEVGETLGVDVTGAVNTDLGERRRSQFRLSFASETDDDGLADVLISEWTTLALALTYRIP